MGWKVPLTTSTASTAKYNSRISQHNTAPTQSFNLLNRPSHPFPRMRTSPSPPPFFPQPPPQAPPLAALRTRTPPRATAFSSHPLTATSLSALRYHSPKTPPRASHPTTGFPTHNPAVTFPPRDSRVPAHRGGCGSTVQYASHPGAA